MKWRLVVMMGVCALFIAVLPKEREVKNIRAPKAVNRIEVYGDRSDAIGQLREHLQRELVKNGYQLNTISGDDISATVFVYESDKETIVTLHTYARGVDGVYRAYAARSQAPKLENLVEEAVKKFVKALNGFQKTYPDPVPRLGGDGPVFYMKFPRSCAAPGENLPAAGSIMIAPNSNTCQLEPVCIHFHTTRKDLSHRRVDPRSLFGIQRKKAE